MKLLFAALTLTVALATHAAAITPKRLAAIQQRAAASNKLIAFVVEQDYYNPGCPTCIAEVNGNNKAIKRAIPKGVIVVKLEEKDLKDDAVPACVASAQGLPRLVITNADCSEVVDAVDVKANKARIEQMEEKISAARGE